MEPDKLKSFAEAFRRDAKKVTEAGKNGAPPFRNLCGWRFGLSVGATRPEKEDLAPMSDEAMIAHVKRMDGRTLTIAEVKEFRAQVLALPKGSTGTLEDHQWILSASLHPRGRSSKEEDWSFLGRVTAALGIPEKSLITPLETTDPSAVHYWIWYEVPVVEPGTSVFS